MLCTAPEQRAMHLSDLSRNEHYVLCSGSARSKMFHRCALLSTRLSSQTEKKSLSLLRQYGRYNTDDGLDTGQLSSHSALVCTSSELLVIL